MATAFEDLVILRMAEAIADEVWQEVTQWDVFVRDVIGTQLARAADSIGANIAESYGRYHYGEKLQFLYYARGSLFETKYWLNRTSTRELLPKPRTEVYAHRLSQLAHALNTFAQSIKQQKHKQVTTPSQIRETAEHYSTDIFSTDPLSDQFALDQSLPLFTSEEMTFLMASPVSDQMHAEVTGPIS